VVRRIIPFLLIAAALLASFPLAEGSSTTLEVAITSPGEGEEVTEDFHIMGTAGPTGSVERVEVRCDGVNWRNAQGTEEWSCVVDADMLEHGPNVIEARAWDGEEYSSITTRNYTLDRRPDITGHGYIRWGLSIFLMGNALDDGDHLVRVEMSIDNGPWFTVRGTEEWSHGIEYEELSEGSHTAAVRAYDGNTYSRVVHKSFNIVHRSPQMVTQPVIIVNGEMVRSFNGTGADEHGIEMVCYRIDGGEWVNVTTTGVWSFSVDTRELTSGNHKLVVKTYDGMDYSEPYVSEFYVVGNGSDPDYTYFVAVVGFTTAVVLLLALLVRRYNRDR
jgi:hypothetical protein